MSDISAFLKKTICSVNTNTNKNNWNLTPSTKFHQCRNYIPSWNIPQQNMRHR